MKAITVKQPWAWLIVNDYKPIENRSWKTKYRGEFGVHASLQFDTDGYRWVEEHAEQLGVDMSEFPLPYEFVRGAIIGSVEIVDCVINHHSVWAEKSIDCKDGCPSVESCPIGKCPHQVYNWVLANPIKFPKPIPCKGKLSFWEYRIADEFEK